MKIKYFRFLYCVTKSCFIHFGEVKDTKMGETLTFLYLKSAMESAGQTEEEKKLFLCPNCVDYVVLGQIDKDVKAELEGLLEQVKVGTLVIPAEGYGYFPEKLKNVDEIVYLGKEGEVCGRQTKDGGRVSLRIEDHLERKAAGWKLSVRSMGAGNLAMLHMHETDDTEVSAGGEEKPVRTSVYDDCVMNVKSMDEKKRCRENAQPDEFGCALGCILYQDYDVCKYRNREEESEYLTGTLVLGSTDGSSDFALSEDERKKIRFWAADNHGESDWASLLPEEKGGPKRYCIATDMRNEAVAGICKGGMNRVPVLLQEGCGICCAGLMKYAEHK